MRTTTTGTSDAAGSGARAAGEEAVIGGAPAPVEQGAAWSADLPALASIHRDRAPKVKPDALKRGPSKGPTKAGTMVDIYKRIADFPGQCLANDAGKLFCKACKTVVTNTSFLIKQHLGTATHKTKQEKFFARADDDAAVHLSLTAFFMEHPDHAGGSVHPEIKLYRYRVVEAAMGSAIVLNKLDKFRPMLERGGMSLTDSSHMKMFIPLIRSAEIERLLKELTGHAVAVSFDGTRRVGEAVCVTARFITTDFHIEKRLIALITTAKHLVGKAAAALVTQLLVKDLQIDVDNVVGLMRDSVAANGVAARQLVTTFPSMSDILCICHTLNHVGSHFKLPVLAEFISPWIILVGSSEGAKALWSEHIGEPVKGYSAVRWYCTAEIEMQIAQHFDQLGSFLDKLVFHGIGDATTSKMIAIYRSQRARLRLELAAIQVCACGGWACVVCARK
jgi:hypothetical protein